jgi:DNA polymerase I-like protein with 3'-5' exonuclease and polymerase domains
MNRARMPAIPDNIGGLSMAETFVLYRDVVGLRVYPVYPPWANVRDAGKQPALRKWWDFNPHNCNVEKYFKTKHPYNIGACPQPPIYFIDLDSKQDKGASVRAYIASKPELDKVPRHASRGGEHLIFICEDLPVFLDEHGNRYMAPLRSQLTDKVSAELFHSPHSNLVLPSSLHPLRDSADDPYFVYAWTQVGEISHFSWQWLQDTFGFKAPEHKPKDQPKKRRSWRFEFRGDLSSLDLVRLLEELGHQPIIANADEQKYSILCPWHTEHTDDDGTVTGTSTVIWQDAAGERWPGFDCKHGHCAKRRLKELLGWAESKSPGIVDRYCARERVWDESARKHIGTQGRPRVLHAEGRLESEVYTEVGSIIAPHHAWFNRAGWITHIEMVPSGFEYSHDPAERYKIVSSSPGFRELGAIKAKGLLEKYMEPGVLREDDTDENIFVPKSFTTDFCAGMVQSDQLKAELDHITRILPVPLPFRIGDQLAYPQKGFDRRFGTYLVPDSPELDLAMPIDEAWELIAKIFSGFCFTNEQSRTHAIARMLTPFARALLGWTTRVPLWAFIGSRPRCGKDYLSGCVLTIYEGAASEDLPITGKESAPETGKRILAAARAGRRFMHFSNCEQNLRDTSLTQVITNPMISGRNLGTNDPKADITVPNEMEFSVSFNLGISIADDLSPRSRPISLAFAEEDPNSRTFPDPHLHRTIKTKRAKILSAFAAIFKLWAKAGFPNGSTPFASFVEWAEIIGGVMLVNREAMYKAFDPIPIDDKVPIKCAIAPKGWGDPCLPWTDDFAESVLDRRTAAMTALFIACQAEFGDNWVKNKAIIACVTKHQTSLDADDEGEGEKESETSSAADMKEVADEGLTDGRLDALNYFGRLDQGEDAHKNKANLMRTLRAFKGRILAAIKLSIEPSMTRQRRDRYKFLRRSAASPKTAEDSKNTPREPQSESSKTAHYEGQSRATSGADNAGQCENPQKSLSQVSPLSPKVPIFPTIRVAREKKDVREGGIGQRDEKKESLVSYNRKNGANGANGDTLGEFCLALDLETCAEPKIGRKGRISATGDALDPLKGEIRLVTLADPDGNIRQFDLYETPVLPPEILAGIATQDLIIHHAAFDLGFLAIKFGLWPERVFCTLTASRLLDPLKSVRHSLGPVLERYVEVELPKEYGTSDWGAMMLTAGQLQYARDDVRYLHRLRLALISELAQADLTHVFALEMALLPIITRMELHGFAVDVDRLKALFPEQRAKAEAKLQAVREAFGKTDLNPNSSDQVLAAFKEIGIELVKSNPDGSQKETSEEELLCTIDDPRAQLILEYRKGDRLASAMASLLKNVRADGRIYAQFNPLGATSGRFSSRSPNLQQVPKKGAREVRSVFVASSVERSLIVADYSQIELRVAALVAEESVMINAFKERIDLHSKIAAVSLRIPRVQVTPEQRDIGKTINFGFLYGRSAEGYRSGVRKDYGLILSPEQALTYRSSFFSSYPAIAAWHEECRRKAKDPKNDRTRTIFGRLLCAQKEGAWARFNLWTNYVVQGACADLLKMAMVKIASILPGECHLVATVHDELIYDVPADLALQYCDMIRLVMEEVFIEMFGTTVPIMAEAKVCSNWGEK